MYLSGMKFGLSLYDVMTRVTPGAVLIAPLTFTPNQALVDLTGTTLVSSSLVVFIVLSLISGEAIDLARENFIPVPMAFRRFLYHETGREGLLSRTDRWRLKVGLNIPKRRSIYTSTNRELYYEITSKFELNEDYEYVRDLYLLLLNDLDNEISKRTYKLKTNYTFAMNMMLAILGFSIIATIRALTGSGVEVLLAVFLLVVALIASMALFMGFYLYGRVEVAFVDSLISEFYVLETKAESSHRGGDD